MVTQAPLLWFCELHQQLQHAPSAQRAFPLFGCPELRKQAAAVALNRNTDLYQNENNF